ncbi:hypothetical protein BKA70DRAFT_1251130 [Coprinopsis sp. MPI-PUGE-AT-0042]|nr:hypothetical protein BKA70DRAFT_1251130 [Coprinopsis sp. MPI-PUGE-AT-0042]
MIVPTCPSIEDMELLIRVRTHPTLQQAQPMNDTWGDTDRLQEIGAQVIHMALTSHFFNQKPILEAGQIQQNVQQTLSDAGSIGDWVTDSGLRRNYMPPDRLDDHTELRKFFETYVGAVWFTHGMAKAHNWITALVSGEPTIKDEDMEVDAPPPTPAPSGSQPPQYTPNSPTAGGTQPSDLITLALVNEIAMKRGARLEWQATSSGPPHLPLWEVACLLDGQERGRAQGPNQKRAKEAAGRQAVAAMGWV